MGPFVARPIPGQEPFLAPLGGHRVACPSDAVEWLNNAVPDPGWEGLEVVPRKFSCPGYERVGPPKSLSGASIFSLGGVFA